MYRMLQERLTDAALEGLPEVIRQDVDRYYARHRRQYRGSNTPGR
jgi:hypothetical protein